MGPTHARRVGRRRCRYWLEHIVRPDKSNSTYRHYRDTVETHIEPLLGKIKLDKLRPADVRTFLRAIEQKTNRFGQPLTAETRHGIRSTLSAAIQHAVQDGQVARNVVRIVPGPRRTQDHDLRFFTPEEADIFMEAIKGDELEALYRTAFLGLRRASCWACAGPTSTSTKTSSTSVSSSSGWSWTPCPPRAQRP